MKFLTGKIEKPNSIGTGSLQMREKRVTSRRNERGGFPTDPANRKGQYGIATSNSTYTNAATYNKRLNYAKTINYGNSPGESVHSPTSFIEI